MRSQTTTNKRVTDNKAQMFTLFFLLLLFSFVVIFHSRHRLDSFTQIIRPKNAKELKAACLAICLQSATRC